MATPNFDIETPLQEKFWGSRHRLNRAKAIIAFSLDEDNANDNMRRAGIQYHTRQWYLRNFKQYINHYTMVGIPFSPPNDKTGWWEELTQP